MELDSSLPAWRDQSCNSWTRSLSWSFASPWSMLFSQTWNQASTFPSQYVQRAREWWKCLLYPASTWILGRLVKTGSSTTQCSANCKIWSSKLTQGTYYSCKCFAKYICAWSTMSKFKISLHWIDILYPFQDRGWEKFTDAVIRMVSDVCEESVVFLLWGSYAQKKAASVNKRHHLLKSVHPSPLSAHRGFIGCKHFSKCNEILVKEGRKPIDWSHLE